VCADQQRNPHSVAVAYLDLDDFKEVNDSMGHVAGDELLRQVGERLSASVRQQDTLARLSGDSAVASRQERERLSDACQSCSSCSRDRRQTRGMDRLPPCHTLRRRAIP